MSELISLISESFGNVKDLRIYRIKHETDTDNLDMEIIQDDDLEDAIEIAKIKRDIDYIC